MSWQHIRGHDSLIGAFDQVVRRGRLAHAYLFIGPAGVGKRLFADELAKALLCEGRVSGEWSVVSGNEDLETLRQGNKETRRQGEGVSVSPCLRVSVSSSLEACDHCTACKLVDAGTHPDLQIAGRPPDKSEVPVEMVRGLARGLDLKPARGRGRIVIIDDADDLNEESANCFLKTLEEPPPGALLILIGTSADRQLATIVSRCQMVHFHPLPEALVAELLASQHIKDAAFVRRVARLSGGSPGQALALADPALWEFRRKLIQGLTQPRPDSVGLAQDWMKFVEEVGKESAAQRRRASLILRLLIDFLNDALSVSVGKSPRLADETHLPLLQKFAKQTDTAQ